MSEDLLASFWVIGVTGILVIGLFGYLHYRQRQNDAQLRLVAQKRGWQMEVIQERLVSGYRLSGEGSQGRWFLELLTTAAERTEDVGSSGVGHSTRWWQEHTNLPDRMVVIGPAGTGAALKLMGGSLAQLALQVMLGKDANWASQLAQVAAGSPNFQARFLCLAQDGADVQRLLTPETERHLLQIGEKWKVVVKLGSNGLEINLPTVRIKQRSEIEMIVNLGEALGLAWKKG